MILQGEQANICENIYRLERLGKLQFLTRKYLVIPRFDIKEFINFFFWYGNCSNLKRIMIKKHHPHSFTRIIFIFFIRTQYKNRSSYWYIGSWFPSTNRISIPPCKISCLISAWTNMFQFCMTRFYFFSSLKNTFAWGWGPSLGVEYISKFIVDDTNQQRNDA